MFLSMVLQSLCKTNKLSTLERVALGTRVLCEMEGKVLRVDAGHPFSIFESGVSYEPGGGACLHPLNKVGAAPLAIHPAAGEQSATSRHAAVLCNR